MGASHTGLSGPNATERLSERQRQCLDLVAEGRTSKEIARTLKLSPSTVDNHVRAALERLGLNNRADAARLMQASSSAALAPALPEEPIGADREPFGLFRLPPIGGAENRLSLRRRYVHVIQIALLGTMGMTAVVMTIAGLVQLFSK